MANCILTDRYLATHGRQPRGYGLYLFETTVDGRREQFHHTGTWSQAKAAALSRLANLQREHGLPSLEAEVLP